MDTIGIRPSILRFAEELEKKLREDEEKCSSDYLLARLEEEFENLSQSLNYYTRKPDEDVIKNCILIGLHIMLIAENKRKG